uniref:Uncharacterized protein n=1 Tax=Gossypium raimondii TaxID=29730 RepID=A0A0D2SQM2_GOSRA|nr:hypothetical protein B456_007G370600 [Gossypium raimondii]
MAEKHFEYLMNPLAVVALMYCLSVNVTGFVHVGFQAYTLAYRLVTKKHVISPPWIRLSSFHMPSHPICL